MRAATALAAALLAGCAVTHETSLLVGAARPAIPVDQVRLYTSPPKHYQEIAIISADAAHDFMSKQALLDKAVQNAKAEAAKVGANGILLDSLGDTQLGASGLIVAPKTAAGVPAIGTVGTVNRTGKQITGKAIYVIDD